MQRNRSTWIVALSATAAVLAAVASAAGVFMRGDLSTRAFVSVRGEQVDVLTTGVYRFNGINIAAEGVGWDAVTLFLVVPALIITLPWLWRGSLRATLVATGVLTYLLYQYFEYATFLAYGPLFLLYVLIVAVSVSGIALLVGGIDLAQLSERFTPRFPRRAMVGLGLFMALLLTGMWLPLVGRTLRSDVVAELYGGTTLVVQAFDLGLLVPLGMFTAIAVYRRLPIGYLLASVVVVKAIAMATAIVAMLLVESAATGVVALPPIAMFATIALVSTIVAARVYSSIEPASTHQRSATSRQDAGGLHLQAQSKEA